MKKILLGICAVACLTTASVADVNIEHVNLGEIQTGQFYGKSGVSVNTIPTFLWSTTKLGQTDLGLISQPHFNVGIQEDGKFMGEIGVTNTISFLDTDYSNPTIIPTFLYGMNYKTFTADKKVSTSEHTELERYSDLTFRIGNMISFDKFSIIYGLEKGVLTGDVDLEKFVGANMITNVGVFGVELRKTDLGNVDATTATASFSMSF